MCSPHHWSLPADLQKSACFSIMRLSIALRFTQMAAKGRLPRSPFDNRHSQIGNGFILPVESRLQQFALDAA
jgi:hypothetical protein